MAVQAPVKGKGIATNTTRAKSRKVSNDFECRCLLQENNHVKYRARTVKRKESSLLIVPRNGRSNTGTIFPATDKKKACQRGNSYTRRAKGIAPLSSTTGEAATRKVNNASCILLYCTRFYLVSTTGPFSLIAMVSSKWQNKEPSFVL